MFSSNWEKLNPKDIKKRGPKPDLFFVERKTRLELATPTLARLCSTN